MIAFDRKTFRQGLKNMNFSFERKIKITRTNQDGWNLHRRSVSMRLKSAANFPIFH